MTKAFHAQSNQVAELRGYHHGKKAHIVELANGEEQYWRNHSVQILEDKMATNKILMKVSGSKGKIFQSIERIFDTVEEAAAYLNELLGLNEIESRDKKNHVIGLSNGWTVYSNYNIEEIIAKKPAPNMLQDTFPFDLRSKKKVKASSLISKGSFSSKQEKYNDKLKRSAGKIVKLSDLTDNPKKARQVLRGLVRTNQIVKPSRWEWDSESSDLEVVKKALS